MKFESNSTDNIALLYFSQFKNALVVSSAFVIHYLYNVSSQSHGYFFLFTALNLHISTDLSKDGQKTRLMTGP